MLFLVFPIFSVCLYPDALLRDGVDGFLRLAFLAGIHVRFSLAGSSVLFCLSFSLLFRFLLGFVLLFLWPTWPFIGCFLLILRWRAD